MKKGYIVSAIIGGTFFAIPYLALNVGILPSVAIGGIAYGAGTLIFKDRKKEEISLNTNNLYDILKVANEQTSELERITKLLEDESLVKNVKEICSTSRKIIETLSRRPEKMRQAHNFLNYYLPVTIKILKRYDEIENNKLTSESSKRFMKSVQEMIVKIKAAFNEQLSNMYQSEIIDTDAEIKVFETMLKADGFIEELGIENKKEENQ